MNFLLAVEFIGSIFTNYRYKKANNGLRSSTFIERIGHNFGHIIGKNVSAMALRFKPIVDFDQVVLTAIDWHAGNEYCRQGVIDRNYQYPQKTVLTN